MEAFKIKNGLSAKRYLGSTTTLSGSTIDLSLGSMFSTTLSSDPAYAFTNPPASGNAQAFSVEVTGGTTNFVNDSFATTLFTGTGSAETVNNGLDLAGDGGLVWLKARSTSGYNHTLYDTERSGTLFSDSTNAASDYASEIASYNNNGFTTVSSGAAYNNVSGVDYVSWTFKKQTKFFDIVTWTGTGGSRAINHNLGSVPGMIIVKWYNVSTDNWAVYHRGLNGGTDPEDYGIYLNLTNAAINESGFWNDTAPTSTQFTVGGSLNSGFGGGGQYIAYLFAHDTASDSRIQCGSYTEASSGDQEISIGWAPQWVMIKAASTTSGWFLFDTVRGMSSSGSKRLAANTSGNEITQSGYFQPTATGFLARLAGSGYFGAGTEVVYMAIRGDAATDSAITWPSSVKWPSGVAPTTPAPGTKDLFTFLTTDGGTTYFGKKAAEGLA